jgi:hypothetical protein
MLLGLHVHMCTGPPSVEIAMLSLRTLPGDTRPISQAEVEPRRTPNLDQRSEVGILGTSMSSRHLAVERRVVHADELSMRKGVPLIGSHLDTRYFLFNGRRTDMV